MVRAVNALSRKGGKGETMNPFFKPALADWKDQHATIHHFLRINAECKELESVSSSARDCRRLIGKFAMTLLSENVTTTTLRDMQRRVSSALKTAKNERDGVNAIHSYGSIPAEWTTLL